MKRWIIEWVFILVALIPAVLLAQWDTSLFDGEGERWGHGYERAQQCYSGVVERAKVTWGNSWSNNMNTTPRRWGSSWTLKEAKNDVEDMLGAECWVNTAEASNGNYDTWFSSGTNKFPCLNASNILVNAGAPTNWFEDHPHWGVVTHSNGWEYLDDVINEMYVIKKELEWDITEHKNGSGVSKAERFNIRYNYGEYVWTNWVAMYGYGNPVDDDDYGWGRTKYQAKTNLVADWVQGGEPMRIYSKGYGEYQPDAYRQERDWNAHVVAMRGKYFLENPGAIPAEAEVYMKGKITAPWIDPPTNAVYNALGLGITTNYSTFRSRNLDAIQTITSDWVQTSDGLDDVPTWASDPNPHPADMDVPPFPIGGFTNRTWCGIIFEAPKATLDYSTDFKYTEQP